MVGTAGAALAAGPADARLRVTVDREVSERGAAEQVRLSGAAGDARLWGLVRRQEDGREWVRWSAEGGRGADRWILGGVRGWTGGGSRGWGDPLSTRGGREEARATLAAAPAGAAWIRSGRFGWEVGGGRGLRGRPEGLALLRGTAWSAGAERRDGVTTGVAQVHGGGAAAWVTELAASSREGRLRFGAGGGRSAAGLTVDGAVRRGGPAEWTGRAGARADGAGGTLRVTAELRLRRARSWSEGRADWERRARAGAWRAWARQSSGGSPGALGGEVSSRGNPSVRFALEGGGARSRRRASFSVSGRAGAARVALTADVRSGSARRASISVGTGDALRSWRFAADWRRGVRPAIRVSWSGTPGGEN